MKTGIIFALAVGASLDAVGLPLEEPLNLWLRHLEVAGEELYPAILPWSQDYTAGGAFAGIAGEIRRRDARPSRRFVGENTAWGMEAALQGEYVGGNIETAAGVKFRVGGSVTDRLTFDHQFSIWTGSDDVPPGGFSTYHIHPNGEPGRHLYPDWGWIDYTTEKVSLRLGRFSQQWGPGRFTNLLVSDNSPPLDLIRATLQFSDNVSFTGFTSTIEPDSGSWFSAHRLDMRLRENLRVGVFEGAFYTTETVNFAYTNPILFWYAVQWNEADDDNLFMGLDAVWMPHRNLAAYVEWLIDDFQYQTKYNRPHKMGGTAGLNWVHPGSGLAAALEYTAIQKYVYSQKLPRNIFLHNDRIIGSELGPDADRITLSLGTAGMWPLLAEIRGSLTRHGEGTVYDGFGDTVTTGEPWPSGIIETTRDIEVNLSYRLSGHFTVFGSAGYTSAGNAGNSQDSSFTDTRAMLRLVYGI